MPSPLPPTLHPFVSTRDTTLLIQLLRFSILFGGKLYKQLQVLEVASFVQISYSCLLSLETYTGFNSLKLFISKLLMCDLDHFFQNPVTYTKTARVSKKGVASKFTSIVVIKVFTINLPSQPFLGHHLRFHILLHSLFGAASFFHSLAVLV